MRRWGWSREEIENVDGRVLTNKMIITVNTQLFTMMGLQNFLEYEGNKGKSK